MDREAISRRPSGVSPSRRRVSTGRTWRPTRIIVPEIAHQRRSHTTRATVETGRSASIRGDYASTSAREFVLTLHVASRIVVSAVLKREWASVTCPVGVDTESSTNRVNFSQTVYPV